MFSLSKISGAAQVGLMDCPMSPAALYKEKYSIRLRENKRKQEERTCDDGHNGRSITRNQRQHTNFLRKGCPEEKQEQVLKRERGEKYSES